MQLSDLMAEAMRQKVQKEARSVPNNKLNVYSTVQLSTEIEAIKKQERALMTKVESQQYLEDTMRSELNELTTQLDDSRDTALKRIEKAQVN